MMDNIPKNIYLSIFIYILWININNIFKDFLIADESQVWKRYHKSKNLEINGQKTVRRREDM